MLRNMKVTVIPVVIGILGRKPKRLGKNTGERIEIIQTTDRPEYREESLRPEETCCRSDSCERPPVNAVVKNLLGIIIIIIITVPKKVLASRFDELETR